MGNRLSLTQGTTTSYTYDKADRIQTAGTMGLTVDSAGNETVRGTDSFAYDQANRVKSATVSGTTTTYAYAYDANRSLPVVLSDGSGKYVWGNGLTHSVDSGGIAHLARPLRAVS